MNSGILHGSGVEGFRVAGSSEFVLPEAAGSWVWRSLELGVWSFSRFRVQGLGFRVQGLGF